MYESCIKRLLDLILSLAACVVLAIPMGIIALWIKKDSPGPVFFKQRRVGRGKKCFNILKFRTMRGDTPHDVPTHLLKNADSYITKSGAFLRRTSLDELPQIYNIVAGQMSIIGPRPLIPGELEERRPPSVQQGEARPHGLVGPQRALGHRVRRAAGSGVLLRHTLLAVSGCPLRAENCSSGLQKSRSAVKHMFAPLRML